MGNMEQKIEERHVGRILIHDDLLLKWLQFEGAVIYRIHRALQYGYVEISLEHPDMPPVKTGEEIPIVNPSYQSVSDSEGHLIAIRRLRDRK